MAGRRDSMGSFLAEAGPARLLRYAYLKGRRGIERRRGPRVRLALALQGGGALGAFTWGALDRLLEEPAIAISAASGASAGALNAAVLASGLVAGGRRGARRALASFWGDVSRAAGAAKMIVSPLMFLAQTNFVRQALGAAPQDFKQLGIHPLRDIISRHVDFDALRSLQAPRLYVSATNVRTAKARIFVNEELTLDALLASACLPSLHPTVWIEQTPYWDGGFSSNPPLVPLLEADADRSLLIRLIRPGAEKAPGEAAGVEAYVQRLLFGRPLEEELARLALMPKERLRPLDEIDATAHTPAAALASAPTPRLTRELFECGRAAAADYCAASPGLSRASSIDRPDRARKAGGRG